MRLDGCNTFSERTTTFHFQIENRYLIPVNIQFYEAGKDFKNFAIQPRSSGGSINKQQSNASSPTRLQPPSLGTMSDLEQASDGMDLSFRHSIYPASMKEFDCCSVSCWEENNECERVSRLAEHASNVTRLYASFQFLTRKSAKK